MTKEQFQTEFKEIFQSAGYWSDEMLSLNIKAQSVKPYHIWIKWHNEIKAVLK